jgi:hypothetical protein
VAEQTRVLQEAVSGFKPSILDAITPGRKRKDRYENLSVSSKLFYGPGRYSISGSEDTEEGDLVILPSEDLVHLPLEEKVTNVNKQLDSVVNSLQKLTGAVRQLRTAVGTDFQELESRLLGVEARLGTPLVNQVLRTVDQHGTGFSC